jgi:DNA-binding FadR family transcriptional regulator
MSRNTRQIVRLMDLNDSPNVLEVYELTHRPGNTPAAVLRAQRRHGIMEMEIYRAGDRLIMIMEVTDAYDPAALDAESALSPEITAWHERMAELQRAPFADGVGWPEAHLVFRQSEHDLHHRVRRRSRKIMTGGRSAETPVGARRSSMPLRLHGTIARRLGIAILAGEYNPGDRLDTESAASEQLAVSPTTYREAMRILVAKGLVDARPRVGTRINARTKWRLLDVDVLEWMFETEPDVALLNSLFELRNLVESAAAGLAATRRSNEHLEAMRASLGTMAVHTLATARGRQADLEFHATLLDATGNPYIISLSRGVIAAISTTNLFKQRRRHVWRDPIPDHVRVFAAIEDRDSARAQKAMSDLIELARTDLSARSNLRAHLVSVTENS